MSCSGLRTWSVTTALLISCWDERQCQWHYVWATFEFLRLWRLYWDLATEVSSKHSPYQLRYVNHDSWSLSRHFKSVVYLPIFEVYLSWTTVCISLPQMSNWPPFKASKHLAPLTCDGGHMSLCILCWALDLPEEGWLLWKTHWEWCDQTGMTLDTLLFWWIRTETFLIYIFHNRLGQFFFAYVISKAQRSLAHFWHC